jgi:hypothetical protein
VVKSTGDNFPDGGGLDSASKTSSTWLDRRSKVLRKRPQRQFTAKGTHSRSLRPLNPRLSRDSLEFKLIIAQVEKLLENEHLEKDQWVNPLAPCIALALAVIALVKQWAERFPWD